MRRPSAQLVSERDGGLYDSPWGLGEDNEKLRRENPETRTFYNTAIALGKGFTAVQSVADMSCGPADIPRELAQYYGASLCLGDLGKGYEYEGPIIETVSRLPVVDLFVCTETLEHLESPERDLRMIRAHCRGLLLTTPVDETEPVAEGHLWVWSAEDVNQMLRSAGFTIKARIYLHMPGWYDHCAFGMWACE